MDESPDSSKPEAVQRDDVSGRDENGDERQLTHRIRNLLIAILLLIAAALAALAASGKLEPLLQEFARQGEQAGSHPAETAVPKQSSPVKAVVAKPAAKSPHIDSTAQRSPSETPRAASRPAATGAQAPVSSAEVAALLGSINQLSMQLDRMSAAQQALQNGLKEQQQMNLQVRLRWITDPSSRLPQLQLAWEEISLLPGLSDAQRSEAVRMHALARSRVQQLKQWQDALHKWADALVTPVHRNILPEPEQPWLAWIVGQFQLRQAPSIEARRLADLRQRLLDAARHLTLEAWPSQAAWQQLQAELLLQTRAMREEDGSDESGAIDTGLPDSFDAIRADIDTLRRTALQWQQEGTQ